MMNRSILAAMIATLVMIGAFVGPTHHTVWDHGNSAELLWKQDEAFLFVGTSRTGWSGNRFQWFWQIGLNYLGLATQISDNLASVVVFRLTSAGVDRREFQNASIGAYYVFHDHIYGAYDGGPDRGSLAKWSGTRFERTSPEERQRVSAGKIPCTRPGCEFSDVDGWSHVCCILSRTYAGETRFPVVVGGQPLVLVVRSDGAQRLHTIDLQRAGRAMERLWSVEEQPRHVSAAEYAAFLKR